MEDLNKKREFNYGIALLRTLMCFEVVLCHFWTTDVPKVLMPFSVLRGLAVPVFMFLSFFFNRTYFLRIQQKQSKKENMASNLSADWLGTNLLAWIYNSTIYIQRY